MSKFCLDSPIILPTGQLSRLHPRAASLSARLLIRPDDSAHRYLLLQKHFPFHPHHLLLHLLFPILRQLASRPNLVHWDLRGTSCAIRLNWKSSAIDH